MSKAMRVGRYVRLMGVVVTAALLHSVAQASAASLGYVSAVIPAGPTTYFTIDAPRISARPACATQGRWALDATSAVGQQMIASVLTAFVAHKHITVVGTGFCDISPDSETIGYFSIDNS